MIQVLPLSLYSMILLYFIVSAFFLILFKKKKLNQPKAKAAFLIFSNFIICVFLFYCLQDFINIHQLFISISLIFGMINLIILRILKLYKPIHGIFFLFFTAFVIYFGYISYTPYFIRQHDSRNFQTPESGGHFGYIGYLYQYGHLPTVNPKDYWCFFNPPLFYIVSAVAIKIQTLLGLGIDICFENLQLLSLFNTIIFEIYTYRILKKIGVHQSLFIVLSFVMLSPALVIMCGSINNDILAITLSTMALFYAIKWFETDQLLDLIKIAFCISFAMMTKINSALMAIVIGSLFLVKLIRNRAELKKYCIHFAIFAIISLPIGLWFPIKNWIQYDIPPTYVQSIESDSPLSLSKYSVFSRFFQVDSTKNLTNVNVIMLEKHIDYNIFFTTLKSFIIDEKIDYSESQTLDIAIHTLFYLSIAISFVFAINVFYLIVNYKKIKNNWILLFFSLLMIEIISYLKFCFDFPFPFTMNFRYIILTLLSFSALTGLACDHHKVLFFINSLLLTVFSMLSCIMFISLA